MYVIIVKTYCVSIDHVCPVRSTPCHVDVGLIDNSGPDLLRGSQSICICTQDKKNLVILL